MPGDSRQIQRLLARVIRDPSLRDRIEAEPEAVLLELELEPADRAILLAQGIPKLLAYHEMVHSRLFQTISTFIGGAASRLGKPRLHADLRRWMQLTGPHTPYLRDVPHEFVTWARPQWEAEDSIPRWVPELAAHQVLIRTLRNTTTTVAPASDVPIDLDRPISCNKSVRLLRYHWAVHRLPKQLPPDREPKLLDEGHAVIGFRDLRGVPRFVDIKPRSAAMLERLLSGQTLREALFGACEAMGETLDDQILSVTALTLADLSERHVLLGGT